MRDLPKYWTQDELRRCFDEITSRRDRALFAMIYPYGPRVDEVVALTLDDLDLQNHRLRLRRLKIGVGGGNSANVLRQFLQTLLTV